MRESTEKDLTLFVHKVFNLLSNAENGVNGIFYLE